MNADTRKGRRELVRFVAERFERYREGRRPFEPRWEEAYYNTLGEYAPSVQGQWRKSEAKGSRIFVRLTRQKVREALRHLEPSLHRIRFDLVSPDPGGPESDSALAAMRAEVERVLALARASDQLVGLVWDAAWSGTGILRAPVLASAAEPVYARDPATGMWASTASAEPFPAVETVPLWAFYPDPDGATVEGGEGVAQLHRVYPHEMRRMVARAGWDAEAVARLAASGEGGGEEEWERSVRAAAGGGGGGRRVKVVEYWGVVPSELLASAGVEVDPAAGQDAEAVVVMGGDELLKAAANPWTPPLRPYLRFRWEPVPHQFWGVGVAENIRDAQKMINGASRLLVDNKALAANCMFEIDVEALVPGQDLSSVHPGKKWVLRPGARGPAVRPVEVPDVGPVLLEMIQLFQVYADQASGVAGPGAPDPAYARTATGLAIAQSALVSGFHTILRRLDDEVIEPLVERVYRWIMEYGDPDLPRLPARVRAVSTAAGQAKELRSQRLMEFLNLLAGPLDRLGGGLAGRVRTDRIVEELAECLDVRDVLREHPPALPSAGGAAADGPGEGR